MGEPNDKYPKGHSEAQRGKHGAIESREACAGNFFEKSDEAEITHGASKKHECQRKYEPAKNTMRQWCTHNSGGGSHQQRAGE